MSKTASEAVQQLPWWRTFYFNLNSTGSWGFAFCIWIQIWISKALKDRPQEQQQQQQQWPTLAMAKKCTKKKTQTPFFLSTESNNKLHSSTGRRRLETIGGGGGSARVWVLLQGRHGGRWVTDASWPYLDAMLCLLIRSKDAAARDGRLVVWLPQRVLHTVAPLHEWRLARPPRCSWTAEPLTRQVLSLRSVEHCWNYEKLLPKWFLMRKGCTSSAKLLVLPSRVATPRVASSVCVAFRLCCNSSAPSAEVPKCNSLL